MFQAYSKKARNLSLSKRATREAITAETLDVSAYRRSIEKCLRNSFYQTGNYQ